MANLKIWNSTSTELGRGLYIGGLASEPFKDVASAYNQSTRKVVESAVNNGNQAHVQSTKKAVEKGIKFAKGARVLGGVIVVGGIATDFFFGVYHTIQGNRSDGNSSFAMAGAGTIAAFTGLPGLVWYGMMLAEPSKSAPSGVLGNIASDNTRYVTTPRIIGN